MKSTLVIFTLNEIEAARALFDRIPFDKVSESFVIDGGSSDGTVEFFQNKGVQVIKQAIPGHGEAFKLGMQMASGDILVFFGCDGNNRPEDIPILIEEIEKGNDLAIASRFAKASRSLDASLVRRFGNWLFAFLVNMRWQVQLTDVFDEFRAIKKASMMALNLKNSYFDLELEMVIKAIKNNLKITTIPTVEQQRIGGQTKLSTIKDGLMNLRCFLSEALRP
jgi:glycosyltransferase involved in cell wall biosynthesis